jgi:bifunctional DNA-binding transcriptional regulator/antitoxin component of YhaV-PrlF toxin-antitoxin module
MTTITIDESGRIEIPLAILNQLGLHPLETLHLEVSEGRLILQPLGQPAKTHREGTALVAETPALGTLDDINQLIDNLREERIQGQMPL